MSVTRNIAPEEVYEAPIPAEARDVADLTQGQEENSAEDFFSYYY